MTSQHTKPELSVIIPVYNTASYLGEAMDSILHQSFRDFEVLAINDGSTDRSGEILQDYQRKDKRVSVFHRPNMGLSASRNFGLYRAIGRYIYFFDSDDLLEKKALEIVLHSMKNTESEICSFSGVCIDKEGNRMKTEKRYEKPHILFPVKGENLFIKMCFNKQYSPVVSMYLYRRSFLKKHNLRFTEGYIHEDEAFTVRALCLAERSISISDVLYKHRIRENSIMGGEYSLNNIEGWLQAYSEMMSFKEKARIGIVAKFGIENRANYLAYVSVRLFRELKRKGKIKHHSVRELADLRHYKRLIRMINIRNNFPALYRLLRRMKFIYSAFFNF